MQTTRARRAGGELILIVAGVLLALSADRWIIGLDEAQRRAAYLQGLAEDLRADSVVLEEAVRGAEERLSLARQLLSVRQGDSLVVDDPADFVGRVERLGWFLPLQFSRPTWSDLQATGGLRLIDDVSLRRALAEYYLAQDEMTSQDEAWVVTTREYGDAAWQSLDHPSEVRRAALATQTDLDPWGGRVTSDDVARVRDAVREDVEFARALGRLSINLEGQQILYGYLLEETIELMNLVGGPAD